MSERRIIHWLWIGNVILWFWLSCMAIAWWGNANSPPQWKKVALSVEVDDPNVVIFNTLPGDE